MPIARRNTRDFRIQALNDAASRGRPLVEEYYSSYRLEWKDLKAWLENEFAGVVQSIDPEEEDDNFIFLVPKGKRLTQEQQDEIKKLKYPAPTTPPATSNRAPSPE